MFHTPPTILLPLGKDCEAVYVPGGTSGNPAYYDPIFPISIGNK